MVDRAFRPSYRDRTGTLSSPNGFVDRRDFDYLGESMKTLCRGHAPIAFMLVSAVFPTPVTALAQDASDDQMVFEEVVVVAEKRSESLQDISQAITVLSSQDLDRKNIVSFVDLSGIAPGVTVTKNEGFKTVIAIRGVGNEANQNAIANPSVSYHLDGVYIASPFALQTDFMDLERIEVLRGPQGTLFGQNSTGGAVNVITRAPSSEGFEGNADLSLGEYNLVRARGSVNVPLGDRSAMRASLAYYEHDGYSQNIALDQELDDSNNVSARLRFLIQPADNFAVHLTGQYFSEDSNGSAQKGLLDPTPGARRLAQDSASNYELTSEIYSLVAEWDLTSSTVKSLTSYQHDDITITRDNDRNDINTVPPFAILPSVFAPEENEQKTFTQEINLISSEPLFGKLDWIAGVFYLDTEVDILIREQLDFNFDGVFEPIDVQEVLDFGGEVGFISDAKPIRESASVYAQGTYNFTDRFRTIVGARFTNDEVRSSVTNFFGRSGTEMLQTTSEKLTGRLALEYDVGDATMFYGSITSGFKPGGSNLTFGREDVIAPILVLPTFQDESLISYELGVKSDFAGGRVRTNAAVFYYDYENFQFQATDPEVFEGGVGNIPQSNITGVELELMAFLTQGLTIDLKTGYVTTEISSDFLALDNVRSDAATNALLAQGEPLFGPLIQQARALSIINVKGNELAKTPGFTLDATLRYEHDIGLWGEFIGTVQYTKRDEFQQRIFNNPSTDTVPSYGIVNVVLTIEPESRAWGFDLMALNATDEDGVNARFTDVFGVGATGDELIPPRQILGRIRVAF